MNKPDTQNAVMVPESDTPVEFGDGRTTDKLDRLNLEVDGRGIPASLLNCAILLDGLSDWDGVFAYDELAAQIMIMRPMPGSRGNPNFFRPRRFEDTDVSRVRMWLSRRMKWSKVAKNDVYDAIDLVAKQRVISPIRHYLEGLPILDATEASDFLREVLNRHFGLRRFNVHPDAIRFAELAFRKWLISAVARALDPGCKADHVLILEGSQGAGKSTAIRILCGDEAFGDSVPSLHTKDAADYVRGKWIIELAELSSVSKAEVEHVKAYITRTEEKFRPAYGRAEVAYPRRCVFIGTTNRTDYLRDETGNRRFWPVQVEAIDHDLIRQDRDRIWAAALSLYRAGEAWWLTPDEAALAGAEQAKRTTVDPLYEEVAQWLAETGKSETCMKQVAQRFLHTESDITASALSPQLQHRIRGALNAAGYESQGRQFTSGDYKGLTVFAKVGKPPK
jgi:predicted P-loop ATPase